VSSDDATSRPPLVRQTGGRCIAGVCGGIAAHLGVNVTLVRFVFALLGSNGVGVVAYLAFWFLLPADDDDGSGRTRLRHVRQIPRAILKDRPDDPPHRRRTLVLYVVVSSIAASIFGAIGFGFGRSGLPLGLALVGALLIW
jgi:phage shock protein PspC (stress-responsive transcriptional regulator)